MNLQAAELKHILKKLSPVRNDTYQIGQTLSAQDSDVWVLVGRDLGLGSAFNISGKKLTQVINRMSGEVSLTREEKKLVLKSARATVELEIQPVKPDAIPEPPKRILSIQHPDFQKNLTIAANSASTNKSAAHGGAVMFQSHPLKIEADKPQGYDLVGTEGSMMVVVSTESESDFEFKYLINLEACAVVQLMDLKARALYVGETDRAVWFRSGDTTVLASKPNKVYPEYRKFIPAEMGFVIEFNSDEFLSALKTVEPLIEGVDNGAVGIQIRENVLSLQNVGVGSTALDSLNYEQIFPDPIFEQQELKIKIKAEYLNTALAKAAGKVRMGFLGSSAPVKIEYGNITSIVMPIGKSK